jgi:hypothetical protein
MYLIKIKENMFFYKVNMTYVPVGAGFGAGAVIWLYGSPESEVIIMTPQH